MLELYGNEPLKVFGTKACEITFPEPYRPEIDALKVLGGEFQSRHLQLIGLFRHEIELGRIDIMTKFIVLS